MTACNYLCKSLNKKVISNKSNYVKKIPKILSPMLLKILMEMGHGDEIVIADGNFPAASNAQRLIQFSGYVVPEVLE